MAREKIIPIQFQKPLVEEMETYVKEGLYSSKAEFVREAVRRMIIELRKQMFWQSMEMLKKLSKERGAKIKTPFLTRKEKDEIFEELKKEIRVKSRQV
jgi:Arc/MetJ-type ribon-helix-helix transcriptional regulator